MGIECAYSFADLYAAAFGKSPSPEEMGNFGRITQEARNDLVRQWAKKAGWEIRDKMGNDGLMYTAFAPAFQPSGDNAS